jgi:ubiquinone/menaquinone biosynthesis C-methylase UbiE
MDVVEIFERYAERYDSWYDRNRDWFLREVELIKELAEDFKLGLEVGVGTGRFAEELGIRYGVDLSNKMLKLARSRGIEVIKADATALPFKDRTFDLVLFAFTLCFLDKPDEALKEAKRVLKDSGKLLVCFVPADSKLGMEYKSRTDNPFYSSARLYTPAEVLDMLKSCEMHVDKIKSIDLKFGGDVVCVRAVR